MTIQLLSGAGRHVIFTYGLDPESIETYSSNFDVALLAKAGKTIELRAPGGTPLPFPPQSALAIVTDGATNQQAIVDWARNHAIDAPILRHAETLPELFKFVAERLRRSSSLASQLAIELADLRALHEGLQNSYASLRELIDMSGLALPRLDFSVAPDDAKTPANAATITQRLPLDFRRISALGFHVARAAPEFSTGALTFELRATDDDSCAPIRWQIPYAQSQPGWTTLIVEQSAVHDAKSAELRIFFDSNGDPGPLLSLGHRILREDRGALVDSSRSDRPLAMRIWTSIPNAPSTVSADMDRPVVSSGTVVRRVEFPYRPDAIEDHLRLNGRKGFNLIEVVNPRMLRVHPLGTIPAVARLPQACPKGTQEILAEVETLHKEAGRVEYGISLIPPVFSVEKGGRSINFDAATVWTKVAAGVPGHILLELKEPLERASDVYLITRMAHGDPDAYAWATFKRLAFRVECR